MVQELFLNDVDVHFWTQAAPARAVWSTTPWTLASNNSFCKCIGGVEADGKGQLLQGGLGDLVSMVLGGLVGASPHMVSACVMALARLLHEFASELGGAAPRLLPTVVLLLRSKSREIVKSVLGFIKVNVMILSDAHPLALSC